MRQTPTRFLVLVLAVASAGGVLMAPWREEWLSILQDEGRQAAVVSLLEPRLARDPNSPALLAALARAYAGTHQIEKATELMERYVKLRPKDADAFVRLADLYKTSHNIAGRTTMLEHAIELRPSPSIVADLARLFRDAGMAEQERALLARFESRLTVGSGLLLRWAELRAAGGDRAGALALLMRADVLDAPATMGPQVEARLFVAGILAESGRSVEAVDFAIRWIGEWQEAWLSARVLRIVAPHAPDPQAVRLADAVVALHPEISLFLARDETEHGAPRIGRHILSKWIDVNPSASNDDIAAFLTICQEQDMSDVVWQTLGVLLSRSDQPKLVDRYVKALAATFGVGALAPFWRSMSPALLARNPLLMAQLAYDVGDSQAAALLLANVDVSTLSRSDRQIWVDLLLASAPRSNAALVLRVRLAQGYLPGDLVMNSIQRLYGFGPNEGERAGPDGGSGAH